MNREGMNLRNNPYNMASLEIRAEVQAESKNSRISGYLHFSGCNKVDLGLYVMVHFIYKWCVMVMLLINSIKIWWGSHNA